MAWHGMAWHAQVRLARNKAKALLEHVRLRRVRELDLDRRDNTVQLRPGFFDLAQ
jgi:hypothetical protein